MGAGCPDRPAFGLEQLPAALHHVVLERVQNQRADQAERAKDARAGLVDDGVIVGDRIVRLNGAAGRGSRVHWGSVLPPSTKPHRSRAAGALYCHTLRRKSRTPTFRDDGVAPGIVPDGVVADDGPLVQNQLDAGMHLLFSNKA